MPKFYPNSVAMKRRNKTSPKTLGLFAALSGLTLAGCSKDSDKGGGGSKVPESPAITNTIAAADLPASLEAQAAFATEFSASLESVLGQSTDTSASLGSMNSTPVTDSVSGASNISTGISDELKELVKQPSDEKCAKSVNLLRTALPITKMLARAKTATGKDAMAKSQPYLSITENPLAPSQAVNLSFALTPEFASKSGSTLSGAFVSGSDGNTYYSSQSTDFDIDFSKFFGTVFSGNSGSGSSSTGAMESVKIKGNTKGLLTVLKDSKILKHSEQSTGATKLTTSDGKTVDAAGSGAGSFELNGTTGVFSAQQEGAVTGNGKSMSGSTTLEIKKVDDTSLTMSYAWKITSDGATKQYNTVVTLKRGEDKNCTASFNPALDSKALEDLD